MATEHIQQMDKLFKDYGERFRENARKTNKILEQVGEAIRKFQESEKKSMLHNVTVKHEENKVLEEYWEMQALQKKPSSISFHEKNYIELDHEPTPQEIADFLNNRNADFVHVWKKYRFESELPF